MLVLVINYTGDRIHFGLATERARREGIKVHYLPIFHFQGASEFSFAPFQISFSPPLFHFLPNLSSQTISPTSYSCLSDCCNMFVCNLHQVIWWSFCLFSVFCPLILNLNIVPIFNLPQQLLSTAQAPSDSGKLDTVLHEPCLSFHLEARFAPDVFELKIILVQVEMVVCGEDCALTRFTVI